MVLESALSRSFRRTGQYKVPKTIVWGQIALDYGWLVILSRPGRSGGDEPGLEAPYPTIQHVWSHCDTVNLDTVSSDDRVQAYYRPKKKTCACCGIFWTTYVRDYNNIYVFCVTLNTYITNIHMLFKNSVTYINVTPTYICCLKIKQHIIKSQWYTYVIYKKLCVV